MNATKTSAGPALFQSVRSSRDLTLALFAVTLLAAFALQAGAFLPRLSAPPAAEPAAEIIEVTPAASDPAVVARRAAVQRRSAAPAVAEPCEVPRG